MFPVLKSTQTERRQFSNSKIFCLGKTVYKLICLFGFHSFISGDNLDTPNRQSQLYQNRTSQYSTNSFQSANQPSSFQSSANRNQADNASTSQDSALATMIAIYDYQVCLSYSVCSFHYLCKFHTSCLFHITNKKIVTHPCLNCEKGPHTSMPSNRHLFSTTSESSLLNNFRVISVCKEYNIWIQHIKSV